MRKDSCLVYLVHLVYNKHTIHVSLLRELGLVPYVGAKIVVQRNSTETRVELIARWFVLVMPLEAFYYFDDRVDQVEAVQQVFRGTRLGSFHVPDPQRLCDIAHSLSFTFLGWPFTT